jgi:hypothetical protein
MKLIAAFIVILASCADSKEINIGKDVLVEPYVGLIVQ